MHNLAVRCDENDIPSFANGSVAGTINLEEMKFANPKSWNSFQQQLTYTCPIGYVVERSGGDYSEQKDPIPEDQESFTLECAADAKWTPRPINGGSYMPHCIRKYFLFIRNKEFPFLYSYQLHRAAISSQTE